MPDRVERFLSCVPYPPSSSLIARIRCIPTGDIEMNAIKMLGIVLIVAGGLGLLYGGFTYTQDTHEAKLGPIELSVKDKKTVNVPIWAGVGAIALGAVLLFVRSKP